MHYNMYKGKYKLKKKCCKRLQFHLIDCCTYEMAMTPRKQVVKYMTTGKVLIIHSYIQRVNGDVCFVIFKI